MKINITLYDQFKDDTRLINAVKTRSPKMTAHRGRTWDVIGKTNTGIDILADTTWGFYGYFYQDNQWYKFKF